MCQVQIEAMKLTEIMVNNKLVKLCIEILGHQKFTFLISQYVNVSLRHLHHSILNI